MPQVQIWKRFNSIRAPLTSHFSMARLVHQSETNLKKTKSGALTSYDLHSFAQSHDFPLRLPRLSAALGTSPEPTSEAETVMLLSQTASRKMTEARMRDSNGQSRAKGPALESMLRPHFCEPGSNRQPVMMREIRALPTSFQELVAYEEVIDLRRSGEKASGQGWGLPFNRRDVELLGKWLDEMLQKLVERKELEIGDIFKYAKGIYSICLDEALVQVGTYCKELGQLLERVWSAYLSLFDKAISVSRLTIAKTETRCAKEIERLRSRFQSDTEIHAKRNKELLEQRTELTNRVAELEELLAGKDETETSLRSKYMQLQTVYEDTKMSNLALKEELRVLRVKLEGALRQLAEGSDDFTPATRIRVKTFKDLKDGTPHAALKADSFLVPLPTAATPKSPDISLAEMLLHNCTSHTVRNEQKLFTEEDFHDQATLTTPADTRDMEVQTEEVEEEWRRTVMEDAKGQINEYQRMIQAMADSLLSEYRVVNLEIENAMQEIRENEGGEQKHGFQLKDLLSRIGGANSVRN